MKNVVFFLTIVGTVLFDSCTNEKVITFPNSLTFKDTDVKVIKLSNEDHLELIPPIHIYNYHIFDSILIIRGEIKENSNLMHLYNLENLRKILSFGDQGRGPMEYFNIMDFQIIPETHEIFVPDIFDQDSRIYIIDSLLQESNSNHVKEIQFKDTKLNGILKLESEKYLCNYCTQFIPDNIMFFSYDLSSKKIIDSTIYPYLDTSDKELPLRSYREVYSNKYSYSAVSNKIVVAYSNTDLIEVYDKNLDILVRIHGPDRFIPQWEITNFGIKPSIRGISRRAYASPLATEDGFYVLYSGDIWPVNINLTFENRCVYFFEYSGKPVVRYEFDLGQVGMFRIDPNKKKMIIMDKFGELYLYRIPKLE